MSDLLYCLLGIVGSSITSVIISWLFSSRFNLVADIVTVPSSESRFSKEEEINNQKGFIAYDTYVILENHGNQSLQMPDFAPLNMPHILINGGRLQKRNRPYRVLPNSDLFAMYNNVKLSYDGKWTINITFDQLKVRQNIEIIVHSLFPENHQERIKLGVAATLKNGKFICKKQLRATYGVIQMIATAIVYFIISAIPTLSVRTKIVVAIVMIIWWPLSVRLVDVISYYSAQRRIRRPKKK